MIINDLHYFEKVYFYIRRSDYLISETVEQKIYDVKKLYDVAIGSGFRLQNHPFLFLSTAYF